MFVYLQHDNEKPVRVPVREPDKLPNDTVTIKGKPYKIFTADIAPVVDIFWHKKRGKQDSKGEATNEINPRDKIKRNLQIFKETGKYPKD